MGSGFGGRLRDDVCGTSQHLATHQLSLGSKPAGVLPPTRLNQSIFSNPNDWLWSLEWSETVSPSAIRGISHEPRPQFSPTNFDHRAQVSTTTFARKFRPQISQLPWHESHGWGAPPGSICGSKSWHLIQVGGLPGPAYDQPTLPRGFPSSSPPWETPPTAARTQ